MKLSPIKSVSNSRSCTSNTWLRYTNWAKRMSFPRNIMPFVSGENSLIMFCFFENPITIRFCFPQPLYLGMGVGDCLYLNQNTLICISIQMSMKSDRDLNSLF